MEDEGPRNLAESRGVSTSSKLLERLSTTAFDRLRVPRDETEGVFGTVLKNVRNGSS